MAATSPWLQSAARATGRNTRRSTMAWEAGGGAASAKPPRRLVLDFYDGHNKQLIWRGVAQETLSDKPDKNEKKLEKSVNKMLDHFPPQGRE